MAASSRPSGAAGARRLRIAARVVLPAAAVAVWTAAIGRYAGFDGVVVRGLDADAGAVRRGATVRHELRVTNLTPGALVVVVRPACGCALDGVQQYRVRPFGSAPIVIPYETSDQKPGPKLRTVALAYRGGTPVAVRERAGSLRFTLR